MIPLTELREDLVEAEQPEKQPAHHRNNRQGLPANPRRKHTHTGVHKKKKKIVQHAVLIAPNVENAKKVLIVLHLDTDPWREEIDHVLLLHDMYVMLVHKKWDNSYDYVACATCTWTHVYGGCRASVAAKGRPREKRAFFSFPVVSHSIA